MKIFKIHYSDYTEDRLQTVLNYLCFASANKTFISDYKAFTNFAEITCLDVIYRDLQNLINK